MKVAILAVSYYNTGSYNSPVWTPITCISDWSVDAPWDMVEASTRISRFKSWAKTLLDLSITGKIKADDTATDYLALLAQHLLDAGLDMLILDGPKTENGVHGWRADYLVSLGKQDQALSAFVFDEVTLKPSVSSNTPKRVTVSAGNPTFVDVTGS